ncbi:MAG: FMN-binding protein [Brotaphodocola sp.]
MTNKQKALIGTGVMAVLSAGLILCADPLYNGIHSAVKAGANYIPGTYAGVSQGFGGDVIALVTVSEDKIESVELTGKNETPEIGGAALETLAPVFAEADSSMVDAVSGSTITSSAAMKAVQHALNQASGKAEIVDPTSLPAEQPEEETKPEITAEEILDSHYDGGLRTGLATIHSMAKSKDAGEKDGSAQVDSIAVAVVIDQEGRVLNCKLDMAQNKMAFTADGKVIMKDDFKTKKELGDDYGMRSASAIGKEWYEQAEAFEQYVTGKTAKEIAGIAVNESMKPTDTDLTSGVTVSIGDYQKAVIEAIQSAEEIGTEEGDHLGLAIVTNMDKSKDAEADKEGQCQAYSTYAAVTTNADGKITASLIDASQGTVKFDVTGKITSDINSGVKTKRQIGDAYGMKTASSIGKEWYEQADAFEDYMIGKTAEEISGIAVDDSAKPVSSDLASSVTISIGDFQEAAGKAAANAN